jgi:hypothetical protein
MIKLKYIVYYKVITKDKRKYKRNKKKITKMKREKKPNSKLGLSSYLQFLQQEIKETNKKKGKGLV